MYLCMHVCVSVCICVHVCLLCIYILYICVCVCACECMFMVAWLVYFCVCVYVHVYRCTYVCICVCMCMVLEEIKKHKALLLYIRNSSRYIFLFNILLNIPLHTPTKIKSRNLRQAQELHIPLQNFHNSGPFSFLLSQHLVRISLLLLQRKCVFSSYLTLCQKFIWFSQWSISASVHVLFFRQVPVLHFAWESWMEQAKGREGHSFIPSPLGYVCPYTCSSRVLHALLKVHLIQARTPQ